MATAGSADITKKCQAVRCLTSIYNEIATAICHTVRHTVVSTVQGKAVSVSCLFRYHLNRPEVKQLSSGFVWDSHRHSADARRPGWIDLTMKTNTNTRHASPHISYIHIPTLRYKHHLHSSNEENSPNA